MQENNATTLELQAEKESGFLKYFQKNAIVKGVLWFALITISVLTFLFLYNNAGSTLKALEKFKLKYLLLGLLMVFIDLLLGGWRNHIFIRKLNPTISSWVSFKANAANMFMGAITPAHGGAGPAQLYIYMSNGVKFIDAFAVALINMGATLIYMPLAALFALLTIHHQIEADVISYLLKYGFTFFTLFLLVFLLAFWKPVLIGNLIQKIAALLAHLFSKRKKKLESWGAKSFRNIQKYQAVCHTLLKENPLLFPLAILISIALYLNKYCTQYVILLGLGIHANLIHVICVQILIQFMIYFAPTPGGSGFAELGIAVFYKKIIPAAMLPLFTVLQRSFILFFPAMVGAFVVIGRLRRQAGTRGNV
ncbi:hypothetical protein A9P82_13875 [Arachidicoccus ginsenosidimutans]|uniref:lysylphosphatidylglycerol synthase transmembrane domain-containing protein n=1 Tax=Arachidicoccus sp. BS20 TaxID=1850526 RepID=UPI0007F11BAE|nr:flippase-like domain-containing protein [Arachidicoccus sp. BS20]ANI90285.1 hypothetical protein A9P82_13875 [Arachidicoccus sp. BS20]